MKKNVFILLIAVCFCSACAVIPSGKEKVMTAYMSSKHLKYYIRPGKMSAEGSDSGSYVMIDFSYQMDKRNYVSNAYTNFTLYSRLDAFIDAAYFLFSDNEKVMLSEISTLDRNTGKGYIRVSTVLEQHNIEKVLKALERADCSLKIILENGVSLSFIATEDLRIRIREAFTK